MWENVRENEKPELLNWWIVWKLAFKHLVWGERLCETFMMLTYVTCPFCQLYTDCLFIFPDWLMYFMDVNWNIIESTNQGLNIILPPVFTSQTNTTTVKPCSLLIHGPTLSTLKIHLANRRGLPSQVDSTNRWSLVQIWLNINIKPYQQRGKVSRDSKYWLFRRCLIVCNITWIC